MDNIDVAYYLIHSMSGGTKNYDEAEAVCDENFVRLLASTQARQIIYLSGISNATKLSKHLNSRLKVEEILVKSSVPLSILRAGIIVGSGSASF